MSQGSVPSTQIGSVPDRLCDIALRITNGVTKSVAQCQVGRNRRGERASRSVGMPPWYPCVSKFDELAFVQQ